LIDTENITRPFTHALTKFNNHDTTQAANQTLVDLIDTENDWLRWNAEEDDEDDEEEVEAKKRKANKEGGRTMIYFGIGVAALGAICLVSTIVHYGKRSKRCVCSKQIKALH
jgi:hypothetical protein